MRVVKLHDHDIPAWDDYVQHSPQALPYHLIGWKEVMDRTYGYPSHYLMAKEGGRIEGVMPLFEIRSRIVGDSLTTLPCGLCAESEEAAVALIERAKVLSAEVDGRCLIIRDSRREWDAGLASESHHCSMVRDLPPHTRALWKSLDSRLRRHIRIAHRSDLEVSMGGRELLDDFHTVLRRFLRDVGTPVFSRAFLRSAAEAFGDRFLIICVRWKGQLIGAYSAFLFRDTIFGAWGGSLHKHLDRRPNHVLYWRYMVYGCEHGFRHIDLGRSTWGSGQYQFKKGWGAEPQPLYQLSFLNGRQRVPFGSTRVQSDYRYRLFSWFWRKLPVSVTQWLGPGFRRHIPFG